ncbi:hypothetical protein D1007_20991 [Hordeum vulgare]|nr:hypothetical protein D1007_20991 [Hordeum vulgare]
MFLCLLLCIISTATTTVSFQMEAVTQRVGEIHIGTDQEHAAELFAAVLPSVLPRQPPRPRLSAPPKSRTTSAPSRRSARQGVAAISTLVVQRAVLRLIQELGELGPKDRMIPKAAAQLMKRFKEPL